MTIYEKGLATVLLVDAVSVLIAIPLARRKVPPNPVYGYRTRATLASESLWYDANAYFGRVFLVANLLAPVAAFAISRGGLLGPDTFLPVSIVVLAAPIVVAGILTTRYVRAHP